MIDPIALLFYAFSFSLIIIGTCNKKEMDFKVLFALL